MTGREVVIVAANVTIVRLVGEAYRPRRVL